MKIHPSAVAITAALIVASVLLAPSRAHACTLYAAAAFVPSATRRTSA